MLALFDEGFLEVDLLGREGDQTVTVEEDIDSALFLPDLLGLNDAAVGQIDRAGKSHRRQRGVQQ